MDTRSTGSMRPWRARSTPATSAMPASLAANTVTGSLELSGSAGRRSPCVKRSTPAYMSRALMVERPVRTAASCASFTMLARSAPTRPGRSRASCSRSTSGATLLLRRCRFRISYRPSVSGLGMRTLRSKRPGRMSAGSSRSARLVAPMNTTPVSGVKPSISVSSWFSVCSRSSFTLPLPSPSARLRPSASSSSTKMTQGATARARLNRSRTRAAPRPTMPSVNSVPVIW
mmetsp:Transcript_5597/g.13953  ORF Transcript_5597/g.13953 Transcript_5597/m.13953 type:complete len:230 (-) Transcript_5597:1911-2600(-)